MFPMAILVTVVVWLVRARANHVGGEDSQVLVPYLNRAIKDGRSRNTETHLLVSGGWRIGKEE
eukprot:15402-Hanusia_phi.AAC.1